MRYGKYKTGFEIPIRSIPEIQPVGAPRALPGRWVSAAPHEDRIVVDAARGRNPVYQGADGDVADHARLRSGLRRSRDLDLPLISATRILEGERRRWTRGSSESLEAVQG